MGLDHVARIARSAAVAAVVAVACGIGTSVAAGPPDSPITPVLDESGAEIEPTTFAAGVVRPVAPPSTEPVTSDAAAAPDSSPRTLPRILLTNDDGWSGGGLLALREALIQDGFEVVVFAPADDAGGTSATLTFGQPLTISQHLDGVFSVDGSPADAVEVGLSLAFPGATPDLVISGPNPGLNVGNAVIHSGTIGAAVTALNEGVPAVAVHTGESPETGAADYSATNAFVVDLVEALVENAAGGELMPDGLGLNVNVPFTLDDAPPAGVAITTTDRSNIDPDYTGVELPAVGDSVDVEAPFVLLPTSDQTSDAAAVEAGLVSITFIEGNFNANTGGARDAEVAALVPVLTAII